jgi:hypothetical protein
LFLWTLLSLLPSFLLWTALPPPWGLSNSPRQRRGYPLRAPRCQ